MAPWPAQGNEPKAPDKSKTSDCRTVDNLKSKSEPPEDKKLNKGISKEDQDESKKRDVHSLDDGQLKALLDEAIQYKNPKDREGKSKIFRELLQKAEADDNDISYPVIGIRGSGGRRALRGREGGKSITISERASRGGSLQNIFHASSSAEFDTHHCGTARKKNKRQGPGSSVSARQREGGSLPSNVNAGWPLESWQSDQIKKKGLFDRDTQQANHVYTTIGNTAYCNSSSVATTTQARRQTLKHSASNELPSTKKQSPGDLYPLRRHHSSSDQLKSFELSIVKLKNQSESTSMVRKVPQVSKPSDCVSLDVGSLNLEMKKLNDSDPSLGLDKKLQNFQNNEKFRITSCEMESENSNNTTNQGVYTTSFTASLEVEPVDSSIELGFGDKKGSSTMGSVQLSDNYPSVQCIVGERTSLSDSSNQGRFGEQQFAYRPHMYRNLNMNMIVNISSKTANESPRTDENGNALNIQSLTTRGPNPKKNYKRKLLAEKNVVFSQNIAGYRGDNDIETLLNFIESDKAKNKQLKKSLTKGKKQEKKRQNMQKSTSLEEVSQRNIEDLTESSESERTSVRKPRVGNNADTALRDKRRWGEQGFLKSGSQNDLNIDQGEENNSDSEFQTVTKKQRKRKVNETNPKRVRNHRNSRRSPRRKSTSSVPPSERSADSDLDSVHSLPVGGAPTVSYADIAAGNAGFFSPKVISELNSYNNNNNNNNSNNNNNNVNNNGNTEKINSVSAVKTNEIEKWCDSVSQHWEKKVNNNNKNLYVNNKNNNCNISNSGNNNSGFYKNNSINANNNIHNNNNLNVSHTYINTNSDLKNCTRHDNKKQNLENVENVVNEICDHVKKLKDLIIVDKSVESDVTSNKDIELSLKSDFKKVTSNCDLEQCKLVDNKTNDSKKNWSKKNFSREDFPSLPIKSEVTNNYQKNKEVNEQNTITKAKQSPSLPEAEKLVEEKKCESNPIKTPRKPKSEEEVRHRRSNRSKSVGPNPRPPVILLQDERTKDTSVCEITFGFEVNEQLLTSDSSAQVFEEESEAVDETFSSSSKSSCKSNNELSAAATKNCDHSTNVELCSANGGIIYNEPINKQNAYLNSTKTVLGDVTNSTLQELFKRHETMTGAKVVQSESSSPGNTSGNSIANKYVPPVTPIQFNHDKIVTFVGMAWEDVIKNGKIQYYTGDN